MIPSNVLIRCPLCGSRVRFKDMAMTTKNLIELRVCFACASPTEKQEDEEARERMMNHLHGDSGLADFASMHHGQEKSVGFRLLDRVAFGCEKVRREVKHGQ